MAPPEKYEQNLRELVARLKKSGALGTRAATLQKTHNVHVTDEGSKVLAASRLGTEAAQ